MPVDLRILDALPDAFLVMDGAGRIVWAGGAAVAMFRAGRDELVGTLLKDHLAPAEWARLERLQRRWEAGWDTPGTCRLGFTREGKPPLVADVRVGAVELEGERLLVLSARDLTSQLRAESLIAQLVQLPAGGGLIDGETLVTAADPVFAALGWTGGFSEILPDGSITRRIFGPGRGDPVADYGRSLLDRKLPFSATPILTEVVRNGAPIFLADLPVHEEGPVNRAQALTESLVRARLSRSAWCPVFTESRLTHVLSVTGRDLTENDFVALQFFAAQLGVALRMGELRAELVRRERLAAVGELAAVLAHEVRNPIGVVFNAVAVLRRQVATHGAAIETLGIIDEEAERLSRLVRELLEFAGPSKPEIVPVEIRPLLEQSIDAATKDPSCRQLQSRAELSVRDELPHVLADPAALRRALVNLLVNAFQHVRPGGQVRVCAEQAGAEVRIRIENDGNPLPAAVAERIFQPFFTTRDEGTGLGLPIVRRIVEDLRGRITLDPRENGVSFSLWLPSAATAAPTRIAG